MSIYKFSIWPYEREKYFSDNKNWNAETIQQRAKDIGGIISELFPEPQLEISELNYKNFCVKINNEEIRGKNQKSVF